MAKVNWTEEAVRWLQEIRDYIAQDNPDAAGGQIDILGIFHDALDIDRYL